MNQPVKRVLVAGYGTMGRGVALSFARAGFEEAFLVEQYVLVVWHVAAVEGRFGREPPPLVVDDCHLSRGERERFLGDVLDGVGYDHEVAEPGFWRGRVFVQLGCCTGLGHGPGHVPGVHGLPKGTRRSGELADILRGGFRGYGLRPLGRFLADAPEGGERSNHNNDAHQREPQQAGGVPQHGFAHPSSTLPSTQGFMNVSSRRTLLPFSDSCQNTKPAGVRLRGGARERSPVMVRALGALRGWRVGSGSGS